MNTPPLQDEKVPLLNRGTLSGEKVRGNEKYF
jgi:hypothetical protein